MSRNIVRHDGFVTPAERRDLTGGPGCTVLLTGLSGSGKSTLAYEVERQLVAAGRSAYVLDGDNLRMGLNSDLGFSPQDRDENVRRVTEVARLMADAGVVVLAPLIAPYAQARETARKAHESSGIAFYEIYVDTPLEICEQRDPKGLYARARAGEITDMTGVDAPYEAPTSPDVRIDGAVEPIDGAVEAVLGLIN